MSVWTVDAILNRALLIEKQSYDIYVQAQQKAKTAEAKAVLKELAQEELKHRKKILTALQNKGETLDLGSASEHVQDLGIVDWLRDVTLSDESTYQEILIFAGKREKEYHEYYSELAERFGESRLGKLFSSLAKEELRHKNLIEKEYERSILQEN